MTADATTYGDLMDRARRAAQSGATALAITAFADVDDARHALRARDALLDAASRHAVAVLGPARMTAWSRRPPPRRGVEVRTARVRSIVAWIDELAGHASVAVSRADSGEPLAGRVAREWGRSRVLVDAATDLVGTHYLPGGGLRPGASPRLVAPDDIGLLASTVALVLAVSRQEPLALRCRQAGISRGEVDRRLPLNDLLPELTAALARAVRFTRSPLHDAIGAGGPIRAGDPPIEWQRRTERIYQRLAHAAARGRVSVRTLHDIAALGLVTAHVLATSGRRPTTTETIAAWRAQLTHLVPLRSVTPADPLIRRDVQRLLEIAHPSHTEHDPRQKARLLDALERSVPILDACGLLADRLLSSATADAWIPGAPRRSYLPDLCPPGTRARRAPPAPAPWPRLEVSVPRPSGWTLT